jgi:hypothetical protein
MKALILMAVLLFTTAAQAQELVIVNTPQGERLEIRPDTYGPGQHSDQYGRTIRMEGSGASNDSRIKRKDAYGPGVHMDQYGAPVTAEPVTNSTRRKSNGGKEK